MEKEALSANLYFFDNHSQVTQAGKSSAGLKLAYTLESSKKYG